MKVVFYPFALFSIFALLGCGPGPEPEFLEGEEEAHLVVSTFLNAIQSGDAEKADALTYAKADYIIKDHERCRELFFETPTTGRSVLGSGREIYHRDWHIYVDYKLSYGKQMKQLHFTLVPGAVPKIRSVAPIIPDGN